MKTTNTYIALLAATFLLAGSAGAATVVFSEDFTSTAISQQSNPYYGGWFTPQFAANQWYGPPEATITTGTLQVSPTFGSRYGGILLSPDTMAGAGDYTLVFDLAGYTGDGNDTASITVWTGQGYDLSLSTGNGLILNMLTGVLGTNGSATATLQGSLSPTATGTHSIDFSYDGTSAVGLFFGASTGGWPFPQAQYDNISLTKNDLIPEPATSMLAAFASLALLRRTRKN
jgi:hypothetical protein